MPCTICTVVVFCCLPLTISLPMELVFSFKEKKYLDNKLKCDWLLFTRYAVRYINYEIESSVIDQL